MELYIFSVLIFYFKFVASMTDYCSMCNGKHTFCLYEEGPSTNCEEYYKFEFTPQVIKYIVNVHNDIRNHIASGREHRGTLGGQPSASNMMPLTWDDELAKMAQRWADQCIQLDDHLQHDLCRTTSRFEVGQNILTAVNSEKRSPEIAILILNWYKQVLNVIPSDVNHFIGAKRNVIGQYSQLVWAETKFVGCAMARYKQKINSTTTDQYLHRFICNYGPRGNVLSSPIYKIGEPCSECPSGKCEAFRSSLCDVEDIPSTTNETQTSTSSEIVTEEESYTFSENDNNTESNEIKPNSIPSYELRIAQNISTQTETADEITNPILNSEIAIESTEETSSNSSLEQVSENPKLSTAESSLVSPNSTFSITTEKEYTSETLSTKNLENEEQYDELKENFTEDHVTDFLNETSVELISTVPSNLVLNQALSNFNNTINDVLGINSEFSQNNFTLDDYSTNEKNDTVEDKERYFPEQSLEEVETNHFEDKTEEEEGTYTEIVPKYEESRKNKEDIDQDYTFQRFFNKPFKSIEPREDSEKKYDCVCNFVRPSS